MLVRAGLGLLLAANLVAAAFAFHLVGVSPEALNQQLAIARAQLPAAQLMLKRSRLLTANIDKGKTESENFLATYFTNRRYTYSTIINEINEAAKTAGMTMKEATFASLDPIEGTDDLEMLTVSINFEGGYPQLVKLVNLIDRSPRFLIIESLQIASPPKGEIYNVTFKLNAFVRDTPGRRVVTLGAEPKKVAILGVLLAVAAVVLYMNVFAGDSGSPAPAPRPFFGSAPDAGTRGPGRGTCDQAPRHAPRQPEHCQRRNQVPPGRRAAGRPARSRDHRSHAAPRSAGEGAERRAGSVDAQCVPVRLRASAALGEADRVARMRRRSRSERRAGAASSASAADRPAARAHGAADDVQVLRLQISKTDGSKQAFLLDGDDIIIAGENDAVKRGRYKVVAIGLTSITIEDTQFKSTQTLPHPGGRRRMKRTGSIRIRVRAAVHLRDGRHRRDHALHGAAARRFRSPARQGTAADRSRRTVFARHPALRAEVQSLSARFRRAG